MCPQKPDPEEEMEVRGGGQYFDEKNVKAEAAYDSDEEDAGARHMDTLPDASGPPPPQRFVRPILSCILKLH